MASKRFMFSQMGSSSVANNVGTKFVRNDNANLFVVGILIPSKRFSPYYHYNTNLTKAL